MNVYRHKKQQKLFSLLRCGDLTLDSEQILWVQFLAVPLIMSDLQELTHVLWPQSLNRDSLTLSSAWSNKNSVRCEEIFAVLNEDTKERSGWSGDNCSCTNHHLCLLLLLDPIMTAECWCSLLFRCQSHTHLSYHTLFSSLLLSFYFCSLRFCSPVLLPLFSCYHFSHSKWQPDRWCQDLSTKSVYTWAHLLAVFAATSLLTVSVCLPPLCVQCLSCVYQYFCKGFCKMCIFRQNQFAAWRNRLTNTKIHSTLQMRMLEKHADILGLPE